MSNNVQLEQENKEKEFGGIAQSIALIGLMMSVYSIFYSICFGFAWGAFGWSTFALVLVSSIISFVISLKQISHARKFKFNKEEMSDESKRIGKQMGTVMSISYSIVWIVVIALVCLNQSRFILSAITLIIGIHFLPIGKIMKRRIDYFLAPITIVFSLMSFYFGIAFNMELVEIFAIAGIGGAIATLIYSWYIILSYKNIAKEYGVS